MTGATNSKRWMNESGGVYEAKKNGRPGVAIRMEGKGGKKSVMDTNLRPRSRYAVAKLLCARCPSALDRMSRRKL